MTTKANAIEVIKKSNNHVANLKDWQVPSKAARELREIARNTNPEEFIGTIAEMVAKFPMLLNKKYANHECVGDHSPEDIFAWFIDIPTTSAKGRLKANDFDLACFSPVEK